MFLQNEEPVQTDEIYIVLVYCMEIRGEIICELFLTLLTFFNVNFLQKISANLMSQQLHFEYLLIKD